MNSTIWRFDEEVDDYVDLIMPKGARILSVHTSDRIEHGIALWALADPTAEPESRTLRVYGTGHPIREAPGRFLGSCIDGQFVWHVFEPAPVVGSVPSSGHSDGPRDPA